IFDGPNASLMYRRWMVRSDAALDPQAFILKPECAIAIAGAIVRAENHYAGGKAAALKAIQLLREGDVKIPEREAGWLDTIEEAVSVLPAREDEFIEQMMAIVDQSKFVAQDYDL